MNTKKIVFIQIPLLALLKGVLGALLLLPGFMLLTLQPVIGALIILVYIIVATYKKGYVFDFEKKNLKEFSRILFIKTGKWKSFKNYLYYSYSGHKESYRLNSRGRSITQNQNLYQLSLILNEDAKNQIRMNSIKSDDLKELIFKLNNLGFKKIK